MKKFGYIINPKETRFYQLSGGFNKIKWNLPIIKDEVMKVSEIFDKDNHCIGDVLSVPNNVNFAALQEKLLNYMTKNHLEFICLGDGLKNQSISKLQHHKLITGIHGIVHISVLFMQKYLKEIFDLAIYEAEIVIAIDEYSSIAKEMIEYISSQGNYILLTGKNLKKDEKFLERLYSHQGISIGFNEDYTSLKVNWHVFINLSSNIQMKKLKNKGEKGIVIDPLFLIHEIRDEYKIVSELSMYSNDIVFFNKLNIINNAYSPQLIESLVRIKNQNNEDNIYDLIEQEIVENEYTLIDE
jgi:hypothetical protein